MKKVLLSLAIVAVAFTANAQKEKQESKALTFSVGVDAGFPISPSGSKGLYIGGDVQAEYAATPEIGLTLSAGYLNWSYKGLSAGSIPVLVGGRYYFSDHKVYGSAQLGYTLSTVSGGKGAFTYAPGIGYYVTKQIDVMLKYQGQSTSGVSSSMLALRAAYNF